MSKFKIFALTCLCLLAGASVGMSIASFCNTTPAVVHAEGEESSEEPVISSEEPEVQEEEQKGNEITWENIEAKVKEISNYQVLGMTIGTIVGGLASIGVTFLFKKAEKIELHKFTEISRGANAQYDAFMKKAEEFTTNYGILQEEFKEFKTESALIISELKDNNALLKDMIEEEKKARFEERKFFLDMLSHNKDAVASGLAEELINYFKDKE